MGSDIDGWNSGRGKLSECKIIDFLEQFALKFANVIENRREKHWASAKTSRIGWRIVEGSGA